MSGVLEKDFMENRQQIFSIYGILGLDKVEEELYNTVSDSGGFTREICFGLIESGGKRLRPLLVLCAAQCFGSLNEKVIKTASAFELIHMASLVHDDIIDEASIRRNRPSLNAQRGNLTSVLIGDYLFAKAFEIFAANRLIQSMNLAVEAISEMCDGEIIQANNKFNFHQSIEDYYDRIYKKTGILLSACCQAGAIAGGAPEKEVKALKDYGTYLGYAFQIIDDLLDFTGDPKILGKPVGRDLKEGNITLPVFKLMKQGEYKAGLEKIFAQHGFTEDAYREVIRLLQDSYALEESYKEAADYVGKAKNALKDIKDSYYKNILLEVAEKILMRKS
ncbi:polyprenyl synthetase family protein [Thermotalea metallivorans]|uniref:Heptaprenyl diphosphate synthase component 2 n=1 Tax=Thermotalea metallivorans TaxID=520762 RepID=A0A140LD22_9FIRM|nr:polyprenyl synthetase family protein [Thermotalea metallivorans]KXG78447.1 Heptaprenyl diphosphate synthase component 2 [Thermotalea metallivorans]